MTVRVFPSLHSCIWIGESWDVAREITGHTGLTEDEREGVRAERGGGIGERRTEADPGVVEEMREHRRRTIGSRHIGGALAYLIETPYGSVFWHDTSGCWTGVVRELRPDVALVAMAGRPNVDGEPIQGSLAQFVGQMAGLMQAPRIGLGHHDDWMPPMTRDMSTPDAMSAVRAELVRSAGGAELLEPRYLDATRLLP